MSNLARYADQVNAWAARLVLQGEEPPTDDRLWDMADRVSGGELDTTQMDILTDMIRARIAKWLTP
jgi:hypothetical protein